MTTEKHQSAMQEIVKNNLNEFKEICTEIKNNDDLGTFIRCIVLDELDRY